MPTSPRVRYKRCGVKRNPPVTASPCQPPLGKGGLGTGERIATASVRTGFAMTGSFTWGVVDARAGKSAKRRQWRMQRGDFEEVPRLAATTVAGNRLARRWAREPRPYEVTRGAVQVRAGRPGGRPLRGRCKKCGGRTGATAKGRPGGPPLRFFIYTFYIIYSLFICALRRINLPGAGVCLCRPTRCGPRPGVFPGRWLFPPGRSRCGVRPGSPGPGL